MKCPICAEETAGEDVQRWGPEFAHKRCVKAYSLGGCDARAAIEADRAQRVPDGWKLVPVEPTDAMVRAALHLDLSYMPGHEGPDRAAVYRAMLAAVPARASTPAPAQQEPKEWLPTAENINVLPEPVRRYISELETNCDPAGTVRHLTILQDTVRALEASNRMLRDAARHQEQPQQERKPMTDVEIEGMYWEANRWLCTDLEDYKTAVRDTERHHGIRKD